MKTRLSPLSRMLLLIAGGGLFLVLVMPIWRIELNAPQYPEGLSLEIHASGLKGNVDIINGLNHYIGMKTLHNQDFIEFTILPYCIAGFAVLSLLAAFMNRRPLLNLLFVAFVLFGIVAIVDFWRWEYNYGHNLNPNAAIVVPGMAYQPPLIGFKQLLNFGAYSIPDKGGWIFIGTGLILLLSVALEWRHSKKLRPVMPLNAVLLLIVAPFLPGCTQGPVPLLIGKDNCYNCKMTVTDLRYGGEILSSKGKVFKFDDAHCLRAFLKAEPANSSQSTVYLVDYSGTHSLIKAGESLLLESEEIHGPMNGHVIAFSNPDSIQIVATAVHGKKIDWNQYIQ